MGLRAKYGNPIFLMDQDSGDMTSAYWALRQGVSCQRESAPIALSPIHPLPGSGTVEGSRAASSILARASVASGVCVLWLLIGAAEDKGLCSESSLRAQALVVSTEKARKIIEPSAMRDESLLVTQVVETAVVQQKQILECEREQIDIQRLDARQGNAAKFAPTRERKQALEQKEQEWFARSLTSLLRGELGEVRSASESAAEAERIKQKQSLEQERGRADTLAREVTSLRAELDAARNEGSKAAQAAEAEIKQKEALEQERGRADTLAREVTSLRAELDAARNEGSKAAQAAGAEVEQKQALEQVLKQERDRAAALASELISLRGELDTERAASLAAVRAAEAAKIEQQLAFGKECAKTETLARELASARKEAEERLAVAHAETLQMTEINSANAATQELGRASERNRADDLARELTSVRNELEAGKKQIAALNALLTLHSREPAADSSQACIIESSSRTIERQERSQERISGEAVASTSERSSAAELARPEAQARSTAREAASDLGPKLGTGSERSTVASAATHSLVDEQRLLARANALLRQADISGARPLLEHALEHGSARAAFMLAETYDARVLQSWRARGISGDLTKARQLYERAQAGGIEDAKERIEALK
jgi:hypothetical protein